MRAAWPSLALPSTPELAPEAGHLTSLTSKKAYRIGAENEYAAPIRQTESPTYPRPASLRGRKKAVKINGIRPNDDTRALTGSKPILGPSKHMETARFWPGRHQVIRFNRLRP
jgi:hypothetical protein